MAVRHSNANLVTSLGQMPSLSGDSTVRATVLMFGVAILFVFAVNAVAFSAVLDSLMKAVLQ